MSAQSIAGRSRRPSSPDSDDALLGRALEFTGWAKANVRAIVVGAVVLAALIGGLIYYRVYQEDREQRAAGAFLQLQQTAASGNIQLATRDLDQFIRRYNGTVYAEEARITLAQLHLQENEPAKAVALLEDAVENIDDSPVGPQAALLLAAAQQAAGDTEAAIGTYLQVAEEADLDFRRTEALENAAALRVQSGDFAGGVELYQRLVEAAEEGTPQHQLYQMRLAEASARAQAK